ncbi:MAG: HAD hydrolase-like protein [Kiritimatiellae bacterium]|nr:HAD hydrolase-like protein [Kiritimatiellia bacterium]
MTKNFWFFDLDGTLADTDRDIRVAWLAALDDLGVECPNFERDFIAGPPIEEMAQRLLPGIYTPELGQKIRSGFGRHYDNDGFLNTFEYPGVLDFVRDLKASGMKAYIATNKRYVGAKALAAKFGWDKIFDGLYTGDMHKDDEIGKLRKNALLRLIMKEIGAASDECVMVGDTINDFSAAKENGIFSVGCAWGYGKDEELGEADKRVENAAGLFELLNEEI